MAADLESVRLTLLFSVISHGEWVGKLSMPLLEGQTSHSSEFHLEDPIPVKDPHLPIPRQWGLGFKNIHFDLYSI